ncbi:N-acetylmuramoyl-L-alanine amidase family protein [Empedobacter brevis]|uniref:N-acetylmuramoyl-L-alanine amidase family protein n=1 Tax=Empedobacter brevis TaxID=247 RepID=UPI0039AECFF7
MKKLFMLFCLVLSIGIFGQENAVNYIADSTKRIILLDAGHGGSNTGVKMNEFQEKDIVLKIAKIIQENNPFNDVDFVLLRKGDEQILNTSRTNMINEIKPDLVLSIHVNYNIKESKKGTEILLSPLNPTFEESKMISEKIGKNISSLGFENLGIVETNSKILRDSKVPIIMIEIGYLTNEEDRKILTNESYYPKIADKIYEALK